MLKCKCWLLARQRTDSANAGRAAAERVKRIAELVDAADVALPDELNAAAPLLSPFVGATLSPTLVLDETCAYAFAFLPLHTG
jgi:hypothetical protein